MKSCDRHRSTSARGSRLRAAHPAATVAALAGSLALGACAGTPRATAPAAGVALPSGVQQARIDDATIRRDLAAIEGFQQRIRALNDAGRPLRDYGLAKAQCWVSFALDEYHDGDRTGVIEATLTEADRLLDAMEAGTAVPLETPIVATSTRLRDDLWRRAGALRLGAGGSCASAEAACLEVQLVWAGHEYNETGWRHARHAIEVAERLANDGERRAAECVAADLAARRAAATPPAAATAGAAAPCPPAAATAPAEKFVLGADALFAIGRSDLAAMRPEGRAKVEALAADLKRYARLDSVQVVGHADRLGTPRGNEKLAASRARTVKDLLAAGGVPAAIIATEGRSSREPVVTCTQQDRRALVDCLAPNRRVEIEVRGEK